MYIFDVGTFNYHVLVKPLTFSLLKPSGNITHLLPYVTKMNFNMEASCGSCLKGSSSVDLEFKEQQLIAL